jgi:hypothetical protein
VTVDICRKQASLTFNLKSIEVFTRSALTTNQHSSQGDVEIIVKRGFGIECRLDIEVQIQDDVKVEVESIVEFEFDIEFKVKVFDIEDEVGVDYKLTFKSR